MRIETLTPIYRTSFCKTLSALKPTDIEGEKFWEIYQQREAEGTKTFVVIDGKEVVGTASLIIETKFLHNGGKVAHIEDVAVRKDIQLQGIGRMVMEHCEVVAREEGCYKIILDCGDHNVGFYEKLGYQKHESQMRKDL